MVQPKAPPFQGHVIFDNPKEQDGSDGEGKRRDIIQLPDDQLPGMKTLMGLWIISLNLYRKKGCKY